MDDIKLKKIINILFFSTVFIIILSGIYLRCKFAVINFNFWHDERLLGVDFFDNNYLKFFGSLSPVKIPPLWGILNQFIISNFGTTIPVFRFVVFVSGILSMIAFYFLLNDIFKSKITIIAGLLFFALNCRLIFFSALFRPYSTEVLVCILLLLSYKYINLKEITLKQVFIYSFLTILIMLFSFPAMIIIPSMIFAKCVEEKYFNYKIIPIFLSLAFVCLYLCLIDLNGYNSLSHQWNNIYNGFLNFSLSSFCEVFNNLIRYLFLNENDYPFFYKISPFAAIAGLFLIFKGKNKARFLILFIILFASLSSLFRIYPLAERMSLYLLPVLIIILIEIIDFFDNIYIKLLLVPVFVICILNITDLNKYITKVLPNEYEENVLKQEFKDYSKLIIEKYNESDAIICPNILYISLDFYNKYYKYNKNIEFWEYPDCGIGEEEHEREFIDSYLQKEHKSKKLLILGQFDSWSLSENNFNVVEEELKKYNVKYKKIINNSFYEFEVTF